MKTFIKSKLREEIDAMQATTQDGSINTIIDGERNIGFIVEPNKYVRDIIKQYHLKVIRVPSHPNNTYIIYKPESETEANELLAIAEKYGGYLSVHATKKDSFRIGQLLGYKESDIYDYINRTGNYK